jgi:hypothetical protein
MIRLPVRIALCLTLLFLAGVDRVGASGKSAAPPKAADLRVGAYAANITPISFPVIVNGMFEERTADRDIDPLFARAFVFDDGTTRIAIVVVDSCMLPRELLDVVKVRAAKITGIGADHMLISATHTHSAPSSMGLLGSRPDPQYPAFLIPQLVRAIHHANERLTPAQIGFAKVHAPGYTYCRRYIRRPDRVFGDPFGKNTVRANMHPGFLSPDAVGPSGPGDDELSILTMQTRDGKPLGVLANFSMHYVGSPLLSADYFGRFAEHLGKRLDGSDGSTACIVSMSQGTSGDMASMNYSAVQSSRDYDSYAAGLAEIAERAIRDVQYKTDVTLGLRETKLTLSRRVPDAERLAWAKKISEKIGDRRPKDWPEVYALEQPMLAAEPRRELKLQAIRIGDVAIAGIPNEVYALSGVKLKLQSPLPQTFTIELANGAEGYIPPPEQHKLGGYTTWPARSASLEVEAEPKIVETELKLLEEVTGKSRRRLPKLESAYSEAVMKSKPRGYWRLHEMSGNSAADATGHLLDGRYEDNIAHYLPGPPGDGLSANGLPSRSTHFAGGRMRTNVPDVGTEYSVEFWFWNGLPNDARAVTAYLFNRSGANQSSTLGDCLGIGGSRDAAGKLIFSNGDKTLKNLEGRTVIEPRSWNHIALVREGKKVRVCLNRDSRPEITGELPAISSAAGNNWFFAGSRDNSSNLEGKMSEVALYTHALTADEISRHYDVARPIKHEGADNGNKGF